MCASMALKRIVIGLLAGYAFLTGTRAEAQCAADWSPGNGFSSISAGLSALTTYNGNLIVAGNFTQAGQLNVRGGAQWDGSGWQPLGSGFGTGAVLALAIYNGRLIAGGTFSLRGD